MLKPLETTNFKGQAPRADGYFNRAQSSMDRVSQGLMDVKAIMNGEDVMAKLAETVNPTEADLMEIEGGQILPESVKDRLNQLHAENRSRAEMEARHQNKLTEQAQKLQGKVALEGVKHNYKVGEINVKNEYDAKKTGLLEKGRNNRKKAELALGGEKLKETTRHNIATEGLSNDRNNIAMQRLNIARQKLSLKVKGAGSGKEAYAAAGKLSDADVMAGMAGLIDAEVDLVNQITVAQSNAERNNLQKGLMLLRVQKGLYAEANGIPRSAVKDVKDAVLTQVASLNAADQIGTGEYLRKVQNKILPSTAQKTTKVHKTFGRDKRGKKTVTETTHTQSTNAGERVTSAMIEKSKIASEVLAAANGYKDPKARKKFLRMMGY